MIHFYEELVTMAERIIDAKSTSDDIKVFNDIDEIKHMLCIAQPTEKFIIAAKRLHERLNIEYPEINQMHQTAIRMLPFAQGNKSNSISKYDEVLEDLNSDKFGIHAAVLIKHAKIACIKEFIKYVD